MAESGESIVRGAHDALAYAHGNKKKGRPTTVHVPEHVDVKAIRNSLKLSQDKFAKRFGFSVATVRDWEQGRRRPEGPARALLTVIEHEPEAVERALSA